MEMPRLALPRSVTVLACLATILALCPGRPVGAHAVPHAHRAFTGARSAPRSSAGAMAGLNSAPMPAATAPLTACAPWQVAASGNVSDGILTGVAALARDDVWAVGYSETSAGGPFKEIIQHWDGSRWQRVDGANAGPESRLYGVAAISSHDVWAVGSAGMQHWDGARWRVVPSPNAGRLNGIAAVSSDDVWAVGSIPNGTKTVVEHWDGARWRVVSSPNPGAGGALEAVAAVSRDDVWAVGSVARGYRDTLIEHWDGTRWSVIASPTGPSGAISSLYGVAAITARDVWAVGSYHDDPNPSGALIEHWDGTRWSLVPGPGATSLNGVAAVSARDVWAVGDVTEHWDGARWRAIPNPSGGDLSALAVVSADDVWAVGSSQPGEGATVIEQYAGGLCYPSDAVAQTISMPANAAGSVLDSSTHRLFMANADATVSIFDTLQGAFIRYVRLPVQGLASASVAVDDRRGHVFVMGNTNRQGSISMLDATSGALLRTVPLGTRAVAMAVDGATGRVFVATADGVHMLDAATAGALRVVPLNAPAVLQALDEGRGRLFVAQQGRVSTLDAASGQVLRSVASGTHPFSLVMNQRHGRVAVVDWLCCNGATATITLLDAGTGSIVRVVRVPHYWSLTPDEPAGRLIVATWASTSGGMSAGIQTLDVMSGATVAALSRSGVVNPHVAVDQQSGQVFVAWVTQPDGHVTVDTLDAARGAVSRTSDLGANPDANNLLLALDGAAQRLFVVWMAPLSQVSVLDTTSGAVLGAKPLGASPGGVLVDEQRGRLFVSCLVNTNQYGEPTGPGGVYALDATDGKLLATLVVGTGPDGMLADEQSGQVFVFNGGAYQYTSAPSSLSIFDAGLGGVVTPAPVEPTAPVTAACCGALFFPRTGHNLSGAFLAFWQRYGGVNVFGYPQTEAFVDDAHWVQYTDHFLLASINGQVQTAPLGRLLTAGRAFPPVTPFTSTSDRLYVATTGHSLTGRFLTWWRTHNGATLLGAPISEPLVEANGDGSGRRYLLQWFENGRLEYHPELSGTRYAMELGLLGVQALQQRGWLP